MEGEGVGNSGGGGSAVFGVMDVQEEEDGGADSGAGTGAGSGEEDAAESPPSNVALETECEPDASKSEPAAKQVDEGTAAAATTTTTTVVVQEQEHEQAKEEEIEEEIEEEKEEEEELERRPPSCSDMADAVASTIASLPVAGDSAEDDDGLEIAQIQEFFRLCNKHLSRPDDSEKRANKVVKAVAKMRKKAGGAAPSNSAVTVEDISSWLMSRFAEKNPAVLRSFYDVALAANANNGENPA